MDYTGYYSIAGEEFDMHLMDAEQIVVTPSKRKKEHTALVRDLVVNVPNRGFLTIPKGFCFDGGSIPRAVWTILGITPNDMRILRASCIHDYLYVTGGWCVINGEYLRLDKEEVDAMFHEDISWDGVEDYKASVMHQMVDWFGEGNFEKYKEGFYTDE